MVESLTWLVFWSNEENFRGRKLQNIENILYRLQFVRGITTIWDFYEIAFTMHNNWNILQLTKIKNVMIIQINVRQLIGRQPLSVQKPSE